MQLNELVFLGACQLLAPSVHENGFNHALKNHLDPAIEAAKKVWLRTLEKDREE